MIRHHKRRLAHQAYHDRLVHRLARAGEDAAYALERRRVHDAAAEKLLALIRAETDRRMHAGEE